MARIAIIGSTGGSVFKSAFTSSPQVRNQVCIVASDRECGLIDFAKDKQIPTAIVSPGTAEEISDRFLSILQKNSIDLAISFYTRLFRGDILVRYSGRFINFHPSLLPRHPGIRGFEDTIESNDPCLGATIHLIDDGIDTGTILLQTKMHNNPHVPVATRRHLVFVAQVSQLTFLVENLGILFPGIVD